MLSNYGLLALFGSGETGAAGRTIHRKVFQFLGKRDQRAAVLETPAGFQPNSEFVANEVAEVFRKNLGEFVSSVSVIPARRRVSHRLSRWRKFARSPSPAPPTQSGSGWPQTAAPSDGAAAVSLANLPTSTAASVRNSPDNPEILEPVKQASYIFLGPGSPTYAKRQLENSLALSMILDRWQHGATLVLSSAAALAAGNFTLPVYEIYKAGSDLYWEKGLCLTEQIGLNLTIVTHWNNKEGGRNLDTSRCLMGKRRFGDLKKLMPPGEMILGIDENTAIVIDVAAQVLTVTGKGSAWLSDAAGEKELKNRRVYDLNRLRRGGVGTAEGRQNYFSVKPIEKPENLPIDESELPKEVLNLVERRKIFRDKGLFDEADKIRGRLLELGYEVRDKKDVQKIYIGRPRRPRSLDFAPLRFG